MNKRFLCRFFYGIAGAALIVGAAFHGYRMHPENIDTYKIGVIMGIVMISISVVSLVCGIVMSILIRKK